MEPVLDFIDRNTTTVGTAWHVLVIIVLALVLRALLHRAVQKVISEAVASTVPITIRPLRGRGEASVMQGAPLLTERRRQRTETIGSVLRSVTSVFIFTVAAGMVLAELGFNLGPVVASAGIIGVALGFGAQNLVKDYLNGIFMILEDQYGVGDAVDLGEASGIVEAVGLRVTRVRNVDGTVWHMRNGEVVRVGNMSQGWSRALLDISVAYDTDTDRAAAVIKRVADEVWQDKEFSSAVMEEPQVWGVENFGIDGIAIRLVVKTAPLEQWSVGRELRRRIKSAFDAEGIEIPFPQRTLWMRSAPDAAPELVPDDDTQAAPASE